jgi:hypothetical protein
MPATASRFAAIAHGRRMAGALQPEGGQCILPAMSSQPQPVPQLPPLVRIFQMATAYRFSRALYVAVELGVADQLKDGAKSAEDLAAATQTNADALFRLLRALASVGVFAEAGPREFGLTPLSDALRSDVPGSLRPLVLMLAGDVHWSVYKELGYSVRTGQPAFDHVFGQEVWDYLSGHPELSMVVDQTMTLGSRMMGPFIAGAYDFSKFETIIDVGGGSGELLAAILKQHTRPRGIVFDLPHAIEHARAAALLPEGRGELIAGSFFEAIPAGGDLYLMKTVVHDWPDEKARLILQGCHHAMPGTGTLLLIEGVVTSDASADRLKSSDLQMLVLQNGRERTEEEFRSLLASAGFQLNRIIPANVISIIEASPI